ncbi:UV-endonuclease UvdE [Annulohypoxylon nitens]|nr:UV-endonuclease UvdE [Annulohypoxylon nitens]
MVPKRKRSTVAPQQDIQPELPIAAVRRSGRVVKKLSEVSQSDAYLPDKEGPRTASTQSRGKKKKMPGAVEDVGGAIDGLREMEDNFRDAVKRQKLALDKSSLRGKPNATDEEAAFMPKLTKAEPDLILTPTEKKRLKKAAMAKNGTEAAEPDELACEDREAGDLEEPDANAFKQEGSRPPPVNSDYLPLPWKGRIGYVSLPSLNHYDQACLNTYLRQTNPPVFSSRTCRISSILDHRHPLRDPTQPEHPTKNRPDKDQPADVARGRRYVEALGLANARDIVKMIRWNDKYGIKFMRLSSEMFPFASHEEYGYKLAPFASEALAEAGKVAGELGHRLTTHPGQFTQLGSPRKEVVRNAIRDLEYHDEMLTLLRLPEQLNKDAVMILHMGGVFGDKAATLDRFRENYAGLSPGVKARLVLENDDVSWTVHDLLPICEELNIPMVLDFHHHNILFDKEQIREGTKDIVELYPRIKATWDRKGITQKMHYSEPCSEAITPRQRRKHRPRVMTLPPCPSNMDLMIEAKDKEQAVFDLMRNFRLPGWERFNDVIPYERQDDNRPLPKLPKKKQRKSKKADENGDDGEPEEDPKPPPEVPESEIGMGGPDNRVYWPLGMEEWLRPKKREVKNKKRNGDEIEDD